jgi:hypothetical protein
MLYKTVQISVVAVCSVFCSVQGEGRIEKSRRNQGKRSRSEVGSPVKDSSTKQKKGEEEETAQRLGTAVAE